MSLKNQATFKYVVLGLFLLPFFGTAQSLKYATSLSQGKDWSFVENKGQLTNSEAKYYGHQGGVYLYCKPGMVSFVFTKVEKGQGSVSEATGRPVETQCLRLAHAAAIQRPLTGQDANIASLQKQITTSRTDLVLLNSNPNSQILASDQQEYYENYYTTGNADSGITNVHTFKTITYKFIYPHIDMVLSCREKGMEYSFVVYPGGKVSDIQMKWEGIEKIRKIKDNGIEYSTTLGKIDEGKPVSFQGDKMIMSSFARNNNKIGFMISEYDKAKVLVIDPTLEWGTYFGGSYFDEGFGVSTDKLGNVDITGVTQSSFGIATSGAYQTSYGGGGDAFLAQFSSSGSLVWATYYGGSGNDDARGVSTDAAGNIYITGYTNSSNGIATSGAYHTANSGSYDGFLAKFKSSGSLNWATFFGGSDFDRGLKVSADIYGNVYITGDTYSTSGIATSSAYQTSGGGINSNAFLAKFSSSGSLNWATYYGGGSLNEMATSVSADVYGNIYITGATHSSNGIATAGAYQTSGGGTYYDAFLAKFSSSGYLSWGTYYGGANDDGGNGVSTDNSGNVYITGNTNSSTGIATSGAYQTSFGGGPWDAFLAKFSSSGSLTWATYYGAIGDDVAIGVKSEVYGNIYITGYTSSSSGIATSGAYQTSFAGYYDAFLAKFSSAGSLTWATYYGGVGDDDGTAITTNPYGDIYISGVTQSAAGVATSGAYQTSYQGTSDAFLAKFSFKVKNDAGIKSILNPKGNFCQSTQNLTVQLKNYGNAELDSVKINWSINGKVQNQYNWKGNMPPDSFKTVLIANDSFPSGIDTIKAWTSFPNGFKDSVPENDTALIIDTVYSIPLALTIADTSICPGTKIALGTSSIPRHIYSWTSKPIGFTSSVSNPTVSPQDSVTKYYLTETNKVSGCSKTDSTKISITKVPLVNAGGNHSICFGDSITLGSLPIDPNAFYEWTSMPAYQSFTGLIHKVSPPNNVVYYLVASYNPGIPHSCYSEDSAIITVMPKPVPNPGPDRAICTGTGTIIGGSAVKGDLYKWYSVPTGFSSSISNPLVDPQTNTTYILTETNPTGCATTDSVTITLNPLPKPNAGLSKKLCSGDTVSIGTNGTVPGYLYSWTSLQSLTYPLLPSITITPVISSWYILTATDSATGCVGKDSIYISIYPLPHPKISGSNDVCAQVPNTYSTPFDAGSKYQWTLRSGQILSGMQADSVHLEPDTGFNFIYVKETDSNGCKNTDSLIIHASPLPDAHWKLLSDSPVYVYKAIDTVEQYYQWQFGDGGTGSSYLVSHTYNFDKDSNINVSLTVGSAFGCSVTFDSTIKFRYIPPPNFYIEVFPTPFSETTNIKISLEQSSHIQIMAYDEIGRLVGKLADVTQPAGITNYEFSAAKYSLAYGVYYLEILVDGKVYTRPVVRVE